MNEHTIMNLTLHAMMLVLMLSMPAILVASALGLLVSLIQAITQVQDQTISFAVKLVAIMVTLVITAHWLGKEIFIYAQNIFDSFPYIVK